MEFPEELLYTKEHEWVSIEENIATIGITDYAQEQLGEIVYVDLPSEDETVTKEQTLGVVESTKTASDVFSPVSGTVIEVNTHLQDTPEIINQDCYHEGWLVKIELSNKNEAEALMSYEEYKKFVDEHA